MSFLDLFRRKTAPISRRKMSEEDLDERTEKTLLTKIRKKRIEILQDRLSRLEEERQRRALEEEIAEAEEDLNEVDEPPEIPATDNPDALIMNLLNNVISKKAAGSTPTSHQNAPVPEFEAAFLDQRRYSDQQLQLMKSKIPPEVVDQLKKLDDQQLISTIQIKSPDFFHSATDQDLARAVQIIKEG